MNLDDEFSLPTFQPLIIEDNDPDADLLEAYIDGSPIETEFLSRATNLQVGLEKANELKPDLIFLDLSLTDASALESLEAISAMPTHSAVLVLTGNAQPELEFRALESGADEFLKKDELSIDLLTRRIYHAHGRNEIRSELERTRRAVDSASQGIVIADAQADDMPMVYCNDGFCKITGYSREEVLGRNCRFLQCAETSEETIENIRRGLEARTEVSVTILNEKKSGEKFWNALSITPVFGNSGDVIEFIGVQRDATRRVEAQNKLRERQEELEIYETIIENTTDAVFITGRDGDYKFVNQRFANLVGADKEQIVGEQNEDFHRVKSGRFSTPDRLGEETSQIDHREHRVRLDDESHTFLTTQIEVSSEYERPGVIGISRDVSEQKELREKLERHALFDELTDLPNRTLFQDKLRQAIRGARRGEYNIAIAFLDIDEFKEINDTHGHTFGDIVLKNVASRLENVLRASDTIARHGGDEFMVLLKSEDEPVEFNPVGQRIREALDAPIGLEDTELSVTLSIGFARPGQIETSPQDDESFGEQLVQAADRAMYRAKEHGETSWAVYNTDFAEVYPKRAEFEDRIYQGLRQQEFVPYFQPIVSLPNKRLIALEVLARWDKGDQGVFGPGEFIQLAEKSRLICKIGESIARQACEAVSQRSITKEDGRRVPLYINLSPKQLEFASEIESLLSVVSGYTDNFDIGFEVTETQLLQSFDPLREIAARGIDIVVDDFGTGYSSFERIKELTIDALKLDMRFIHGAITDHADAAIVETVGTLGRRLSLPTIGEGVESPRQSQFLADAGFSAAQGYFFARPQPLEELIQTLEHAGFGLNLPGSSLAGDTIPERDMNDSS